MTLPKKGQWWLNQDKDQLQITRVTRSDVFYNVPATGAVGMCELLYFINRCCRFTAKMKAELKRERRPN